MGKAGIIYFIFLMVCFVANAQPSSTSRLSQLSWLEGKWKRMDTRAGQTAFENWTKHQDSFKGKGITLQGADTVFVETLSIRYKDGNLFYVAEVSHNAEPTYFKITQISETGFVSENPGHDFPKKIEYKLEDSGQLKAIISGDGKSVPFSFQRAKN